MNGQQNSSSATYRHGECPPGKRRRDEDSASGGRGGGRARGSGSGRGIISVGGERRNGSGRAHGRGSIEDSVSGGRCYRGLGRASGLAHGRGSCRGIASLGGERQNGSGRAHGGRGYIRQRRHVPDVNIGHHHDDCTAAPLKNAVSAASSEPFSIENDSDSNVAAATNQHNNLIPNIVTILPWPNPKSHYIPLEEEERQ